MIYGLVIRCEKIVARATWSHEQPNYEADVLLVDEDTYNNYLSYQVVEGVLVKSTVPTADALIFMEQEVRQALQSAIDAKAQALGFSGGNALMLYAGFENAFKPLAQQFGAWEAQVWVDAGVYKAEVLAGNKPMLSPSEAVAMMPKYPD